MTDKEKQLKELIENAKNIVFFTGAGVSTESGIKDFRSKDGLYNCISEYGYDYETILSHTIYRRETETFFDFYKKYMINKSAKPNYFHEIVADLEKEKEVTVITQNIDGLHQLAGSKNVLELHGSVLRNYCEECGKFFDLEYILSSNGVPHCNECNGIVKPDVVLYEEGLNQDTMIKSIMALQLADLLIVAGTSLRVYPAAGLVDYFLGKHLVVINNEKLDLGSDATIEIQGKVAEVFKHIF